MYKPYGAEQYAFWSNTYQPSTSKSFRNSAFIFWERALFQRAASVNEIILPEEWNGNIYDFFKYVLYRGGYLVVFNNDKYGTIFQPCTLSGYNLYYQPTEVLVSNPALSNVGQLTIGENCELLKLTPDYIGIWDIITYYAEKLALLDGSLNMTFINSKIAYVVGAKNKSAAQALKSIMDKVSEGQATVVYDKTIECETDGKEPWTVFDRRSVKESYIGEELLRDFSTIMDSFDREIGIPTLPQEKKERMVVDEAKGKILDSISRASMWEECFNESAKRVNDMFGTGIKMVYKYKKFGSEENSKEEKKNADEDDSNGNVSVR